MNKLSVSINLSKESLQFQNNVEKFTEENPYLSLIQPILLITLKNNYFYNIFQAKLGRLNDYDVQILTINYILKFFLHEFKKDFGIAHFCNTQYDEKIKSAVCHSKGVLFSSKPTMNKNLNKVINHYIKVKKDINLDNKIIIQNENAEIIKYLNENMKNKINMNKTSFSPNRLIEIFTKSLKNEGADISNLIENMYDLDWYLEHNMIKKDDDVRDYINNLGNIYNEYYSTNKFNVLKECEGEELLNVNNEKRRVLQWIFDNSENTTNGLTKGKTLKKLKNIGMKNSMKHRMEEKEFEKKRQLLMKQANLRRSGKLCNDQKISNFKSNIAKLFNIYIQQRIIKDYKITEAFPEMEKRKFKEEYLKLNNEEKNNYYLNFYNEIYVKNKNHIKPHCLNFKNKATEIQEIMKMTKDYYEDHYLKISRGGMKNKKELEKIKMKNKKEVEKMKNKHKKEIEKLKNNHKKELNKLKKCN